MRIAIAFYMQETSSFSPVRTTLDTFKLWGLYENDEVLVMHSIINFPDGTSEAIIQFSELKDGKIIKTETGASLISK